MVKIVLNELDEEICQMRFDFKAFEKYNRFEELNKLEAFSKQIILSIDNTEKLVSIINSFNLNLIEDDSTKEILKKFPLISDYFSELLSNSDSYSYVLNDFSSKCDSYSTLKQDLEFSRPDNNQRMKAEFEFDNYNTKPTVITQAAILVEKIELKKKHLNTVCGVLRVILILS